MMWNLRLQFGELNPIILHVALLEAQASLQLGKIFCSENGVSVSITYSYMC